MSGHRLRTGQGRTSLVLEPLEPRVLLDGAPQQQALQLFSALPAVFVENQGQWSDPSVRYGYSTGGVSVAMTDTGPVFDVFQDAAGTSFSASFVGANAVVPVGAMPSDTVFNYFVGDQSAWRTNVQGYRAVDYRGLYEGIDLRVTGRQGAMKYEFDMAPGADYGQIAVHYAGIAGLSLSEDGSLLVDLGGDWGILTDAAPQIYQMIDGQRVDVEGEFVLLGDSTYGFAVTGSYDPTQELVIDPEVVWSSYLGGTGLDAAYSMAVDAYGSVLVTGYTQSSGWVSGGSDTTYNGNGDAFVAKISSGSLDWTTYLGGSSDDRGLAVAVNGGLQAIVAGKTNSTNLPAASNSSHGAYDAFVAVVGWNGSLLQTTYLGGSADDIGQGIALDGPYAYVTGVTGSNNFYGANNSYYGSDDAFVAKMSTLDGSLYWAKYLGGTGQDQGADVAVDGSGDLLVAGSTLSSTFGPSWYSYNHGAGDAFVAKVSSSGSYVWGTFLGGTGAEIGTGIAADATTGRAIVTGFTQSTDLPGGYNSYHGGTYDGFATLVSSSGSVLWTSYLGGSGTDYGSHVAMDGAGNAFVTGFTDSSDLSGANNSYQGAGDAFVAKLNLVSSLEAVSYIGGSGYDYGYGVAADALGNVVVAGITASADFPGAGNGYSGGFDAFTVLVSNPLREWVSGGTRVSVYDVDGRADVNPDDILVKFGKNGAVSSITIGGNQAMGGLGIVISGASSVGSIKDSRTGPIGDLAFIAFGNTGGAIKSIALKGGMSGYDLDGMTLGGLTFPSEIAFAGNTNDPTAIYSEGTLGKVSFGRDITGDVVVMRADPTKGLSFASFGSKTGGFEGNFLTIGGGGTIALGGDFVGFMEVSGPLKAFQLAGGNFEGVMLASALGKFAVSAGKTAGGGWLCAGSAITVYGGALKSLSVSLCETDNGGNPFSIRAQSFGKITIGQWKIGMTNLPFNQGDLWVELI